MTYKLTLISTAQLTPDTQRLTFDRPEGFDFEPGQAVDMALDREGWRESWHPFTMTSLPSEGHLEFIVKSYPESAEGHEGMTARISRLQPGDCVLVQEPWGAIHDEGDGVFIAGGAGVTPFVSILNSKLARAGALTGNTLVFSNRAERDIILRDGFEKMPGLETRFVVTDEPDSPLYRDRIDAKLLGDIVRPDRDTCYICGPDAMLDDMAQVLGRIGVPQERIVTERFD